MEKYFFNNFQLEIEGAAEPKTLEDLQKFLTDGGQWILTSLGVHSRNLKLFWTDHVCQTAQAKQ